MVGRKLKCTSVPVSPVIHLYISTHKLIKRGVPIWSAATLSASGAVCVCRSVSATEVAFAANRCAVNVKVVIVFTGVHFSCVLRSYDPIIVVLESCLCKHIFIV